MGFAQPARAQDTFEIQVYEYETVPKGKWDLETHFNYIAKGTTVFDGTVAPTQHQSHLTFEFTHGITEHFELAAYLVLANRPGAGSEYAGWRIRPRWSLPKEWHLPVDVSVSAEVGFPRDTYEENSTTLEFRPILERRFGKVQIDLNPVLGRALQGPGTSQGWEFEPGVRGAVSVTKQLDLSTEYYGGLGPVTNWAPRHQQVHQFFFGGDYQFSDKIVLNVGVGFAGTEVGNRLVYKTRMGWVF